MLKYISMILLVTGLSLVGYGGYHYFHTKQSQQQSLDQANQIGPATAINVLEAEKIAKEFKPVTGDVIGVLSIPVIESELPIVEGTDEDDLEKGVGHFRGTAYPLQEDQIVLSGHRDTVFRRMGELKIGDELIVKVSYGEFVYVISDTKVVDADDRTIIQSTAPNEILTVTTCYPFTFIGNAPERYIITAHPKTEKPPL